jgi:hypothetical protein
MMTTARFTVPKQRLAQLLKVPGGLPVTEAIAAAQANLAVLKPQCIGELDNLLAAAEKIFAGLGSDYDEAAVGALYQTAVQGIGLGDVCGAGSVDVALHSLCDLLDHLQTHKRYDREAVGVHLRAWKLLISIELPPEGAQAVLAGLNKVSALYSAPKSDEA